MTTWREEFAKRVGELPQPAEFRQCYVAILDILGYKQMIQGARESQTPDPWVSILHRAHLKAETFIRAVQHLPEIKHSITVTETWRVVSDCVVLTTFPVGPKESLATLRLVAGAASIFAQNNVWIRGAVTRGLHFDENDILFSPAYVEAYEIERNEAHHPRVLVTPEVLGDARSAEGDELQRLVWRDHDGRDFVNYLEFANTGGKSRENEPVVDDLFLLQHKEHIENNLVKYASDPRKAAKYGWLADYHNRFCDTLPEELRDAYRIYP